MQRAFDVACDVCYVCVEWATCHAFHVNPSLPRPVPIEPQVLIRSTSQRKGPELTSLTSLLTDAAAKNLPEVCEFLVQHGANISENEYQCVRAAFREKHLDTGFQLAEATDDRKHAILCAVRDIVALGDTPTLECMVAHPNFPMDVIPTFMALNLEVPAGCWIVINLARMSTGSQ